MKKFVREYWVELLGLIAVLIAIFLLLNRNNIWVIRVAVGGFISSINQWFNNLLDTVFGHLGRMSAAELLSWLLIIGGTVIILYRMRRRYLQSDHWQATVCPKCGSKLHRVHRTRLDRLLGTIFLPNSARYRCSNSSCRWSGLRQGRAPQAGLHSHDISETRS